MNPVDNKTIAHSISLLSHSMFFLAKNCIVLNVNINMGIINTPENPNVMICDNKKRCSTPFIVAVQGLSFKINENLYFDGVKNHKKKPRA